jgi:hypothetical protein
MIGGMQHWPLRITRLLDHGEREHGTREIVSRWAAGGETRTNWAGVARDARRLANALERLGIRQGDRVATLAMNHSRHLVAWYGTIGMGGIIHTINPRLFPEQLVYIFNHAEDRVLFYDHAFKPWSTRSGRPSFNGRAFRLLRRSPKAGFEALIASERDDYRWVEGDERDRRCSAIRAARPAIPRASLRASLYGASRDDRHERRLPRSFGTCRRSADRADVPRSGLGPPVRRSRGRVEGRFFSRLHAAGDVRSHEE